MASELKNLGRARNSYLYRETAQEVEKVREQAQKFFSGGFESTMTVDEACMILGIALECEVLIYFPLINC